MNDKTYTVRELSSYGSGRVYIQTYTGTAKQLIRMLWLNERGLVFYGFEGKKPPTRADQLVTMLNQVKWDFSRIYELLKT